MQCDSVLHKVDGHMVQLRVSMHLCSTAAWHRLQPCMIGYHAGCRSLLHCVGHNIVHKSVAISFSGRQRAPMWGHSMPQCLSLQGCSLPHTFE